MSFEFLDNLFRLIAILWTSRVKPINCDAFFMSCHMCSERLVVCIPLTCVFLGAVDQDLGLWEREHSWGATTAGTLASFIQMMVHWYFIWYSPSLSEALTQSPHLAKFTSSWVNLVLTSQIVCIWWIMIWLKPARYHAHCEFRVNIPS